ncbi:unnamed protein product (macronuclear) [Paramecium tetraurelia]|uniref:Uncharacterized protein n=1 Tax=Paramecium tetraurelia TaxID=5888 RepID=A0DU10_PARTE|nr:uncharacterized protein GSPATT00020211001 [Paramecium tetraurelia]CAK86527.1 unnamed protein product [Paramecium tetraurelia]|eukprot:XP_001453924.1 hypothetical protein (macronuclear) [Paramecium tetraurelia strain d4-2]
MESQDKKHQKRHDSSDKQKELKKIQKLQQKGQALLREEKPQSKKEKKSKKDKSIINREKVIKAFKSFIKIFQDDLEEFFDLFSQLDDGCVIETGGIENQSVKEKLDKLMDKLKLKNQGDDKAPIFKKVNKNIKLEHYVRGLYDEVVKGIKYQEPESSNSNISKSESPEKVKEVTKNVKEQEPQKQQPQRLEENSEMDLFLEENFAQGGERKLTSYLNERKKVQTQPIQQQQQQQQQKNDSIYLGELPQKPKNPEEIKQFMIWYDQEFRPKSLAEEHREKLERERLEKLKAGGVQPNQREKNQRKEFNRDTDMNMNTQTSSEVLARIRQSGSLNQKFSSGHLQNQFI